MEKENLLIVPSYVPFPVGAHLFADDEERNEFFKYLQDEGISQLRTPELEQNTTYRQLVSYIVIRHVCRFYIYRRTNETETRLSGNYAMVGGHIRYPDYPCDYLDWCESEAMRELYEEVILRKFCFWVQPPDCTCVEECRCYMIPECAIPVGYINLYDKNTVNNVHLGIIYTVTLNGVIPMSKDGSQYEYVFAEQLQEYGAMGKTDDWLKAVAPLAKRLMNE